MLSGCNQDNSKKEKNCTCKRAHKGKRRTQNMHESLKQCPCKKCNKEDTCNIEVNGGNQDQFLYQKHGDQGGQSQGDQIQD